MVVPYPKPPIPHLLAPTIHADSREGILAYQVPPGSSLCSERPCTVALDLKTNLKVTERTFEF